MSKKISAFIIGSGIAGITAAIRLAVNNFNVTVFEKNNYPGGKIGVLKKDGYTFDTGPSLFVQPENIEALFKLAGEDIHEYFNYRLVNISCKYFYEDGTVINAFADKQQFAQELYSVTDEPKEKTIAYLNEAKNIYNNIGTIFLNYSLHKTSTLKKANIAKALINTKPAYLLSSLHQLNKKNFSDAHTVQLFNRYATYSGSNPYQAPGMLKLIPHIEFNEGVFYPEGGMISIVNALYKLALKKGVQFKFNAEAQSMIVQKNKAKGLIVNDEKLYADVIISNTDVYFTYLKLLNDEQRAKKF